HAGGTLQARYNARAMKVVPGTAATAESHAAGAVCGLRAPRPQLTRAACLFIAITKIPAPAAVRAISKAPTYRTYSAQVAWKSGTSSAVHPGTTESTIALTIRAVGVSI